MSSLCVCVCMCVCVGGVRGVRDVGGVGGGVSVVWTEIELHCMATS